MLRAPRGFSGLGWQRMNVGSVELVMLGWVAVARLLFALSWKHPGMV